MLVKNISSLTITTNSTSHHENIKNESIEIDAETEENEIN
jgi:hypothetical protein